MFPTEREMNAVMGVVKTIALAALAILGLSLGLGAPARAAEDGVAVILDIKGPIGPATSDYIHRALAEAEARGAGLVILRMDTPGGLDTAMREIIQDILSSPIAVATYVAPSGARAASAGTYILYASHVAAMSPGTNLGAATPVRIGGLPSPGPKRDKPEPAPEKEADADESADPKPGGKAKEKKTEPKSADRPAKPTMADKMVNDAAAYIRGLATMRGRNADWAEKAVREAASLPAEDAVEQNVVDLVAVDVADLLAKIHGREVTVLDKKQRLETEGLRTAAIAPDWRNEFLAVITNPNVAYLLMIIGMYGLIFEFTHPGAMVPGVVGGISLLLALYALQVLPINYAGLGLILLGVALMVSEAFVPGIGVLGIGGVAAFSVGSIMLFETGAAGQELSWKLVAAVALSSAGFFMVVLAMAVKARKRPVVSGSELMIGSLARVIDWRGGRGRVRAQGEVWNALSEVPLKRGQEVCVTALDGLTLSVEPRSEKGET